MSVFAAIYKKHWVDKREQILELYHTYFHTILVTFLMIVNIVTAYSASILYVSQWVHKEGGVKSVLGIFFPYPPKILTNVLSIPFIKLDANMMLWCVVFLNLPILTWLYSTVTQAIKKEYTTIIDWKSKKGRIISAVICGLSLFAHYCALFAWYVEHNMFQFFANIKSDKSYLIVKSMSSFGYLLMSIPVVVCLVGTYLLLKQFHSNEDLRKQFFTWEYGLLSRHSFSLRSKKADVIIGWEKETHKPIVLREEARYLHELVVGATGTGKTSTTILNRLVQDLIRIARGRKIGVCVLEPKGDLIRDVLKLCVKLGIPKSKIKVIDPTNLAESIKYNPFMGPLESASETFRGVLDALTENQDAFFKGQQSETAALYTMLGKIYYGDKFSIIHMQALYTDPRFLADVTEKVRQWLKGKYNEVSLSSDEKSVLERYDRICSYFENEVLDYKTYRTKDEILPLMYPAGHKHEGKQVVESLKDKFVTGAKKHVNDICMNEMLSRLMVTDDGDEVLDIDSFLQNGGILLVNTALGELEELSMSFGQFFIRQFQSSVFRRPNEESGFKRFPIFNYIDEFPLYINESFKNLLTLGRSYMVGTLIAIQSLGQLETVVRGYEKIIMSNASTKTVFGRGEVSDNEIFSKQFGEEYEVEESMNESVTPVTMPNPTMGYRYNTARKLVPRFTPTEIMEQEFKGFIVQYVGEEGALKPPVQGYGKFISETKFLKRFVKIGEAELQTSKYKALGSPSKWIGKLIIDTMEKTNIFEQLEKKRLEKPDESVEPEVSQVTEEDNTSQSQDNEGSELPIRTDVIGEESPIYATGDPEQLQLVQDLVGEQSSSPLYIEMPAQPNPSEEAGHTAADDEDIEFFEGYNPAASEQAAVSEESFAQEHSKPDGLTDSNIVSLVQKVNKQISNIGEEDVLEVTNKPIENWSLEDLIATGSGETENTNSKQQEFANEKVAQILSVVEDEI